MGNSRTKNSALTMAMSSMRQLLTILLTFVSRTAFIYTLEAEYLGLNGLFSNILSILALSELGIGGAIAFYLYKPLADKDIDRIKVLMKFYHKCYNYVGLAILGLGCCLMPFLHYLVNLEHSLPENLYLIYFIFILQNSCTYFSLPISRLWYQLIRNCIKLRNTILHLHSLTALLTLWCC